MPDSTDRSIPAPVVDAALAAADAAFVADFFALIARIAPSCGARD